MAEATFPATTLYPSSTETFPSSGTGEAPRLATVAETARPELAAYVVDRSGQERRLAGFEDETLLSLRMESDAPGGFSISDLELAHPLDLRVLGDVVVRDGGERVVWEGRIEALPGTVEGQRVEAVGHAALLTGEPFPFLGVDSDPQNWGEPNDAFTEGFADPVNADFQLSVRNMIRLQMTVDKSVAATQKGEAEWSAPAGCGALSVDYLGVTEANADMEQRILGIANDGETVASNVTITLDNTRRDHTFSAARRYVHFRTTPTIAVNKSAPHRAIWKEVAMFGDHEMPKVTCPGQSVRGLRASDILRHLLAEHAPAITFDTGGASTIEPSRFVLSQAYWPDPVTLREIVDELFSYEFDRDWFVWEHKTFWSLPRELGGRTWRLGTDTVLSGVGEQAEDAYNGVVVFFERGDEIFRAGPIGSGADYEDASLQDDDPDNPVNASPSLERRYLHVELGRTTSDQAIEAGQLALTEARRRTLRGNVEVGAVITTTDGLRLPSYLVRAGDRVVLGWDTDAPSGYVVKASYDTERGERPLTLTLDNPENRLGSHVARLGHPRRRVHYRRRRRSPYVHHTYT